MSGFVGCSMSLLLVVLYWGFSIDAYVEGEETSKQSTEPEPMFDWKDLFGEEVEYGREPRSQPFVTKMWTHIPYNCTHAGEYCAVQFYEDYTRVNLSDVLPVCHCPKGQECAFYHDIMMARHYQYMCRNITDQSSSTTEYSSTYGNVHGSAVDGAETANSEVNGPILSNRIGILDHAEL